MTSSSEMHKYLSGSRGVDTKEVTALKNVSRNKLYLSYFCEYQRVSRHGGISGVTAGDDDNLSCWEKTFQFFQLKSFCKKREGGLGVKASSGEKTACMSIFSFDRVKLGGKRGFGGVVVRACVCVGGWGAGSGISNEVGSR